MKHPTEEEYALLGIVLISLLFVAGLLTAATFMISDLIKGLLV